MKRLLSLVFLLWSSVAFAQTPTPVLPGQQVCTTKSGSTVCSFLAVDANNPLPVTTSGGGTQNVNISGINGSAPSASNPIWVSPATSALFSVKSAPPSSLTVAGCTVGVASAQCVGAAAATQWIQVQNNHATNTVACSWGGTATLNSNSSFMLAPGQTASWGVNTSGVPTSALNCIASGASTPLYVEYR